MATIKLHSLNYANNVDYKSQQTKKINQYAENYKQKALEILTNPKTTFSEFIEEQARATDISRLWWLKPWAMLKEQLNYLWLKSFVNWTEAVNNSIFEAPNRTILLGGQAA